jgi:hypothetical protein
MEARSRYTFRQKMKRALESDELREARQKRDREAKRVRRNTSIQPKPVSDVESSLIGFSKTLAFHTQVAGGNEFNELTKRHQQDSASVISEENQGLSRNEKVSEDVYSRVAQTSPVPPGIHQSTPPELLLTSSQRSHSESQHVSDYTADSVSELVESDSVNIEPELLQTASELGIDENGEHVYDPEVDDNPVNDLDWIEGEAILPSRVLRTYYVKSRTRRQDLESFLEFMCERAATELDKVREELKSFKLWFSLKVVYTSLTNEDRRHKHGLTTQAVKIVFSKHDIPNVLSLLKEDIIRRNANHIRDASGLIIKSIESGKFSISRYKPFR